jgi:hypothetical protein
MARSSTSGQGRPKGALNRSTLEVREAARAYTAEAIETLASIMRHGTSEAVQILAAKELLDRGYGRPALAASEPEATLIEARPVSIDVARLSPTSRAALKAALLEAQAFGAEQLAGASRVPVRRLASKAPAA